MAPDGDKDAEEPAFRYLGEAPGTLPGSAGTDRFKMTAAPEFYSVPAQVERHRKRNPVFSRVPFF